MNRVAGSGPKLRSFDLWPRSFHQTPLTVVSSRWVSRKTPTTSPILEGFKFCPEFQTHNLILKLNSSSITANKAFVPLFATWKSELRTFAQETLWENNKNLSPKFQFFFFWGNLVDWTSTYQARKSKMINCPRNPFYKNALTSMIEESVETLLPIPWHCSIPF